MEIGALAIRLIVFPVANIDVTIQVNHSSKTILFIIDKETVVASSVRPNLSASAVTIIASPFSIILNLVLKRNFFAIFYCLAGLPEQVKAVLVIP